MHPDHGKECLHGFVVDCFGEAPNCKTCKRDGVKLQEGDMSRLANHPDALFVWGEPDRIAYTDCQGERMSPEEMYAPIPARCPADDVDMVNHPPHYKTKSGIEAVEVIEAFGLSHHIGDAVAYLLRAGKKTSDPIEDLRKARWWIDREIARLGT